MKKIPVTERALLQRINRALAKNHEVLRRTRGEKWRPELGDFYVLDLNRNVIVSKHAEPLTLAKRLDVLKPYEELERC
jgi:hypothetical protein